MIQATILSPPKRKHLMELRRHWKYTYTHTRKTEKNVERVLETSFKGIICLFVVIGLDVDRSHPSFVAQSLTHMHE
jgi:hypothetical protein